MNTLKRYFVVPMMWLTMALTVGVTSLLSAHMHQTQAATIFASPTPQDTPQHARPLLDPEYPGSMAYLAMRAQDRVQQVMLRPEELPVVFLNRSQQRLEAASYAWGQGDEKRALSAVHKSHVYLHRSLQSCQEYADVCDTLRPQAEQTAQDLLNTIQAFQTETKSDVYKASLASLYSSVVALGFTPVSN